MFGVLAIVGLIGSPALAAVLTVADYEAGIKFYLANSKTPNVLVDFPLNSTAASKGCDLHGNWTFIIHGWIEGKTTPFVVPLIGNFSASRGGCVVFVDYSVFAQVSNYFTLVDEFSGILDVIFRKMQKIGVYDKMWCFGFSFGSRLCIELGFSIKKLTNATMERMELCDPAGPGFNDYVDPKPAAKNVACIDTSTDKGTFVYNCHQNFRMGSCGDWQAAAGPAPMGNHGLCPYFYLSSFQHDFVPNNYYNCNSARMIKNPPASLKMGPNGVFNRTLYQGDIFIATAKYPPYLVVKNIINNAP